MWTPSATRLAILKQPGVGHTMERDIAPYPEIFRVAPGQGLSAKDRAATTGRPVLVVCRTPAGIRYVWAPPRFADIGICGASLLARAPHDILAAGAFGDPADADLFPAGVFRDAAPRADDPAAVIVCAPPLSGDRAFMLAVLACEEAAALALALDSLTALDAMLAWDPALARTAVEAAFGICHREAFEWDQSLHGLATPLEFENWKIYGDDPEFEATLSRLIRLYARKSTPVVHRLLPPPDDEKISALVQITELASRHGDRELAARATHVLLAHPVTGSRVAKEPLPCRAMAQMPHVSSAACELLVRLMDEELCVVAGAAPGRRATLESPFVFTLAAAHHFATELAEPDLGKVFAPADARRNLDEYLGGYLDLLDLTKSYITGSAAMSSVLAPPFRWRFESHAEYLSSFYPPVYTAAADPAALSVALAAMTREWQAREELRRYSELDASYPLFTFGEMVGDHGTIKFAAIAHSFANLPNKFVDELLRGTEHTFTITPGADVDIAIDAEGDAFDAIAEGHFRAIQQVFPATRLERIERGRAPMYRVVSTEAPGKVAGFREVEMYPAGWADICTHHVGMVRLAFTAASGAPQFHLAASCLRAGLDRGVHNYYYFASRKVEPQEVVLKYAARGYPPLHFPGELKDGLLMYARASRRWAPNGSFSWESLQMPAVHCRGYYNLYALEAELRALSLYRQYTPPEPYPNPPARMPVMADEFVTAAEAPAPGAIPERLEDL